MIRTALAMCFLPTVVLASDITVENPMVPLAPKSVTTHAAFMTITNSAEIPYQLIGVSAEGYAMAHIHKTEVKDDIATMSAIDQIEIAPGKSVVFESGGLHIMLMRPETSLSEGDTVSLTLEFADGSTTAVEAMVMKAQHGAHGSHGGHGS